MTPAGNAQASVENKRTGRSSACAGAIFRIDTLDTSRPAENVGSDTKAVTYINRPMRTYKKTDTENVVALTVATHRPFDRSAGPLALYINLAGQAYRCAKYR